MLALVDRSAFTDHDDASSMPSASATSTAPNKPSAPSDAGFGNTGRSPESSCESPHRSPPPNALYEKHSRYCCDAAEQEHDPRTGQPRPPPHREEHRVNDGRNPYARRSSAKTTTTPAYVSPSSPGSPFRTTSLPRRHQRRRPDLARTDVGLPSPAPRDRTDSTEPPWARLNRRSDKANSPIKVRGLRQGSRRHRRGGCSRIRLR